MLRPPNLPAFAQRVMQIGFTHIAEFPIDASFLLTVTTIDEIGAATTHDSQLPLGKRIAPLQPARIEHHFPTTVKTGDRVGGVLNRALDGSSKFGSRDFVGV